MHQYATLGAAGGGGGAGTLGSPRKPGSMAVTAGALSSSPLPPKRSTEGAAHSSHSLGLAGVDQLRPSVPSPYGASRTSCYTSLRTAPGSSGSSGAPTATAQLPLGSGGSGGGRSAHHAVPGGGGGGGGSAGGRERQGPAAGPAAPPAGPAAAAGAGGKGHPVSLTNQSFVAGAANGKVAARALASASSCGSGGAAAAAGATGRALAARPQGPAPPPPTPLP